MANRRQHAEDVTQSKAEISDAILRTLSTRPRRSGVVRFAFRLVWQAGPVRFPAIALLQLANATGAVAMIFVTKDAVTLAISAFRSGTGLRPVLPHLAIFIAVAALRRLLHEIEHRERSRLSLRLSQEVDLKIVKAASSTELMAFEHPAFFDLLERAVAGNRGSADRVVEGVLGSVGGLLTAVGVATAVGSFHPILVAAVVVVSLPAWVINLRVSDKEFKSHVDVVSKARRGAYLRRILVGRSEAKEVRAYDLQESLSSMYRSIQQVMLKERERLLRVEQRSNLLSASVTGAARGAVFALAGGLFWTGRMTLPEATAAIYGLQQLQRQIEVIFFRVNDVYEATLWLHDLKAFLTLSLHFEERREGQTGAPSFRRIVLEEVSFTYPGQSKKVIDGLNMEIRAGEVVALVGENGSGKTTLAKLIAQLYKPDSGRILWNDKEAGDFDPRSLRAQIAVLFQDFLKFQLSAAENIALGSSERDPEATTIRQAAKRAGADQFLSRLKHGYDTPLSREFEDGEDLSVGQWQRVALARAVFRDAPLVILDEPTAALDPRAEYELFQDIRRVLENRTVILISHRFSTVRAADKIFVLDGGKITEQGRHEELVQRGGLYATLFALQAAPYMDPPKSDALRE